MDSTTGSQLAFLYPQITSLGLQEFHLNASDLCVSSFRNFYIDWHWNFKRSSSSFLIPSCVAIASAALLLIHASVSRLKRSESLDEDVSNSPTGIRGHVSALGGSVIFGYYLVRLASCFALTGISVALLLKEKNGRGTYIALLCIFVRSVS